MKTGSVSESMVPAYVFVIDIDPSIEDEGLTFRSGHNIERDVRDGHVPDCGPRHDIGGTTKLKFEPMDVSDSRKECVESIVVQALE